MEAFRKIQAARLKKKGLTKKEKDGAAKILKERESLVKQLEASGFWKKTTVCVCIFALCSKMTIAWGLFFWKKKWHDELWCGDWKYCGNTIVILWRTL